MASLTGLTHLDLGQSPISNLNVLSNLTNLQYLKLTETGISDLSPLAGLTSLTTLHLNNNKIIDLSPLAGLSNLTDVELSGQLVALPEINTIDCSVVNPIINVDGTVMNFKDVDNFFMSHGGEYNIITNTISWGGITSDLILSFGVENTVAVGQTNARFSALALQPTKFIEQALVSIDTNVQNGKIEVDKEVAVAGDVITVTVTPDEGYELKEGSLNVSTIGTEIELVPTATRTNAQTFTFVMPTPAKAVKISANFEALPVVTPPVVSPETPNEGTETGKNPQTGTAGIAGILGAMGLAGAATIFTRKRKNK